MPKTKPSIPRAKRLTASERRQLVYDDGFRAGRASLNSDLRVRFEAATKERQLAFMTAQTTAANAVGAALKTLCETLDQIDRRIYLTS